ncbi:MAG: TA system VapC family ribonuclease toxin [Chthoniobacterales bacterium]
MFVVDTNVLVYAADPDSQFHADCRQRIESWRGQSSPCYLTWPICYEFLRVCTHPNVFRRPLRIADGRRFLESLFLTPNIDFLLPTERHPAVLNEVLDEFPHLRGNILHDVHTAVLMREHGIKEIYTRDTDFHRFSFLTVRDPVSQL